MTISTGDKSIGLSEGIELDDPLLPSLVGKNTQAQVDYLIEKIEDTQRLIETKVSKDRIKTEIRYSDETVFISAEDIVLLGDVTIGQIIKEQNGTTDGTVDYSITRIIGDRIQTGVITSNNWSTTEGTAIDLNNDTITMGGSDNPTLYYDGAGNLTITGTLTAGAVITSDVLIDGTSAGDVVTNAAAGLAIQEALESAGSVILTGVMEPTNTGAIKTGTISWNSTTGALTGGTGLAITEYGIIGASSGSTTFYVEAATGNAVFAGSLSAASGTFSGSLSAASGTFTGTLSGVDGTFTGDLSAATGSFTGNVNSTGYVRATGADYSDIDGDVSIIGEATVDTGTTGRASSGTGVYGDATSGGYGGWFSSDGSGGRGCYVTATGGATALYIIALPGSAAMDVTGNCFLGDVTISESLTVNTTLNLGTDLITKSRVNGHLIKIYDTATHSLINTYEYSFE